MTTSRVPCSASPADYLTPTWFVDSEHTAIGDYAQRAIAGATDDRQRAIRLFYAVRDDIRYSAYGIRLDRDSFRASHTLEQGFGWCVTKSCLLAAAARSVGLPCRLGFADVRNHMATEKLRQWMTTDVFYFHGYNEFWLDGRWVKATAAFNRSLCDKARLRPLEFDGRNDSLYHPFDLEGRRHMEYLHDRGPHFDLPYDDILAQFRVAYPVMFQWDALQAAEADVRGAGAAATFEAEIDAEARASESARGGA